MPKANSLPYPFVRFRVNSLFLLTLAKRYMKDAEIIDEVEKKEKVILFSKFSIALMSICISPLFGGFLYCANLRYSNQKEKIFGTFVTVAITNFLILIPFHGLEYQSDLFVPLLYINHIVITLLMIFPFWKNHFEGLEHEAIIPWARIFAMTFIYSASIFYSYWIHSQYSPFERSLPYLPRFSSFSVFSYLTLVIFGRFIFILFRRKKN